MLQPTPASRLLCLLGVALFFFPRSFALADPADTYSDLINLKQRLTE